MKAIARLEKLGFLVQAENGQIQIQSSTGRTKTPFVQKLIDSLEENKADVINYLQNRGCWRHLYSGLILRYDGRRPAYEIKNEGQMHLYPAPMVHVLTILEGDKTGSEWTFTEIQFNEQLERINNESEN